MAVHLMSGLDRDQYAPSVIVLGERCGSALEMLLQTKGIPIIFLGKQPGFDPRTFVSLHRALQRSGADVIHTHVHVLRYALPSLLCTRKRAVLHTVHNLAEREVEPRAQWLQKFAFGRGIVPVACSQEVALSLKRRYGLDQVRVIANCIPVDGYRSQAAERESWRKRESLPNNSILFACVALFRPQKNHKLLLEAFAAGPGRDQRAHLLLAGSGSTELEVREQAKDLRLSDRIHFLGLRDDIPALLGASDVFVLSSDYEGNPLAVMEAMAAGLPVVSTKAGGVPELLSNGREGLLVERGDREALGNAMTFMVGNEGERRAMGRLALDRARNKFDARIMVKAYEDLYERLCDRSQAMTPVMSRA